MLKSIENSRVNIILLEQSDLQLFRGGTVMPPLLPILGAGVGLYMGICGIAYYSGYGAHALYNYITDTK